MIVVAVNDQRRHLDASEVLGHVDLREGFDAVGDLPFTPTCVPHSQLWCMCNGPLLADFPSVAAFRGPGVPPQTAGCDTSVVGMQRPGSRPACAEATWEYGCRSTHAGGVGRGLRHRPHLEGQDDQRYAADEREDPDQP